MDIFITRAAQTAYNRAGYPKDEAFQHGERVARYVHDNLGACRKLYHVEDELELAYRVAQTMVAHERGAHPHPLAPSPQLLGRGGSRA